ncbi:MAG: hypothetical protein AAF385_15680 [Pseudomonadota bacterium]
MKTKSKRVSQNLRTVLILAMSLVVAGCGTFGETTCVTSEDVATARNKEGIVIPEGLDGLDSDKALKIPTATTPPIEPGTCLDEPPKYE